MRADARRSEYLKASLRSRGTFWSMFAAVGVSVVAAGALHDLRVLAAGPAIAALLIWYSAHRSASLRAEVEFFEQLAPELGLRYTMGGHYVPITPLLAAGDRQRFENTMEGPLYGKLGGPPCLVGHFTFETRHETGNDISDVTVWKPHPFTVCAVDLGGAALERFRGVFVRPRLNRIGLDHDWLGRVPSAERVELESARFNELYELKRGADQNEVALRELFSPSFLVWLQEHPLRPGFECKAGTLVVFARGHEKSGGQITLLHEAARHIARRLEQETGQSPHFSAAGQMIR
jgi:hypothetical protein